MPPPNPLTPDDLRSINEGIAKVQEAKELIDMATRAGIEVEEFRARANDAEQKLVRVKQVFFTGQ